MEQMRMDFDSAERQPAPASAKVESPAETKRTPDVPKILSVSDVNRAVRSMLEGNFRQLWIKGEISNFKAHGSGHFYFNLKDDKAAISAVMFRGFNQGLRFKPQDGLEVIVRGKITVYEPRGNYQVFCEMMEPVGAGALQLAFEQLKKKLEAEGLFHASRKRALPAHPRHVVVVTSPTGAAIRDVINVLNRRHRGLKVTVIAAVVQGDAAPASVCRAIALAQQLNDVDVMIVGRGGGSIEDLWAFNDETVVRAISSCRVPVISAVGHEVDFTIADFVADLRAPTPSAAAELVSRDAAEMCETIAAQESRLRRALAHRFQIQRQRVRAAAGRLIDPKRRLQDLSLRCDELSQRLEQIVRRRLAMREQRVQILHARLTNPRDVIRHLVQRVGALRDRLTGSMARGTEGRRARLGRSSALLDAVSPLRTVDRGFTITRIGEHVVKRATQLNVGDHIELTFAKGKAKARVDSVTEG